VQETIIFCKKNQSQKLRNNFPNTIKIVNSKVRKFYPVRVQWTFRKGNWQNRSDDIQECLMSDILEKRNTAERSKR